MKFSAFGERLTGQSGIVELMDDLGNALAAAETGDADKEPVHMLGGGNPACIPEVASVIRESMTDILADSDRFDQMVNIYDPPQGDPQFCAAIAALLNKQFGWPISAKNIALTSGSQSSFFLLFNMLAGTMADGSQRKIVLPLCPEYIGYADLGLSDDFFTSTKPLIQEVDDHVFKYAVDFDHLIIDESAAAICASRPTNPTGNVITDEEVAHLSLLAKEHDIPFIIDGAYGLPFPGIIFTEAEPHWEEHVVVTLSLSKLGLPGVRTGIVVANEQIIQALSQANTIMSLAPNSIGPVLTQKMVESGDILSVARETVLPWYRNKCQRAQDLCFQYLKDIPWAMHKPEGALFLWLTFPGLPITSAELYARLKARGVLVVSGHYFFHGIDPEWQHQHECIRLTYVQDDKHVEAGIHILAEELRALFCRGRE